MAVSEGLTWSVARRKKMKALAKIQVKGVVQGVGFRPFIHRLAKTHHLRGYVLNDTTGVKMELEGEKASIEKFYE